jgi:hypothetical protein
VKGKWDVRDAWRKGPAGRSDLSVSVAALNAHTAIIRFGRFCNFHRADVREDIDSEVGRHVMRQRSERPILIGILTEISKPQECSDAPPLERTFTFNFASSEV